MRTLNRGDHISFADGSYHTINAQMTDDRVEITTIHHAHHHAHHHDHHHYLLEHV